MSIKFAPAVASQEKSAAPLIPKETKAKASPTPISQTAARGRKPDPNAKKLLTLRLDPDVIEHFKSAGDGWQTRMNDALRRAAGL
jgi:uncharacterized protein (DUF4415 family)